MLYQRSGRVFPAQGPTANTGFGRVLLSDSLVGLLRWPPVASPGPEFAIDRLVTVLQQSVRRLEPDGEAQLVCQEAGVDIIHREFLLLEFWRERCVRQHVAGPRGRCSFTRDADRRVTAWHTAIDGTKRTSTRSATHCSDWSTLSQSSTIEST